MWVFSLVESWNRMRDSFQFKHVEILALVVDEVVHQLRQQGDLFGWRAEYGILAEVDFVFI